MWHVRVFAKPVGRFHSLCHVGGCEYTSCRFPLRGVRVFNPFCIQLVAVLVVWLLLVVDEEVDACGKEVHGRGLEELVRPAATLFLAFLQGLDERLCGLLCGSQVIDVFLLDGIDPTGVFHIHEIDDVESASFGCLSQSLVLLVVVIELGGQGGELVVIEYHGKALCRMLPDERLDDGERLS